MIDRLRVRRRLAAAGALGALGLTVVAPTAGAAPVQPIDPKSCAREPGSPAPTDPWAQRRLDLARVATVTQGLDARTGTPIRVAVLDSGFDPSKHPQLAGVDAAKVIDVIPHDPGRGYTDCYRHGTEATAIIAAQRSASAPSFFGIAPKVRIIPIKLTNSMEVESANVARAIDAAIAAHAQIANVSLSVGDDPRVEAAVARARNAGMLIVAAAGNDSEQANHTASYPAKYSTKYDNVIGVAATQSNDALAGYSDVGSFVDLAAPGKGVQSVGVAGGYRLVSGTSFAAPYVTGAAALVLAQNPAMTPAQVRSRLEATADPPPETVPGTHYGYGIVNPYLAVTAVSTDLSRPRASTTPAAVRLGVPPPAPDRTLQHVALGAGIGLLGLAALVVTGAAVLRGNRGRARPGRS